MASRKTPKNKLQGAALREFRHKVSLLKSKGGVSKRVDARKQRATRYMVAKVRKLEPVLQGKAQLIPKRSLRADILSDYSRTHQTIGRNVMIPKAPAERVRVRGGMPEISRVLGTGQRGRVIERRIPLPVDIENLEDFIIDLRINPQKWASERGPYPPWVFGFTIYGNRSHLFIDPEQLADWLERYLTVDDPGEAWENFILYAIDSEAGPWAEPKGTTKNVRRGQRGAQQTAGYRRVLRADAERNRRLNMTEAKAEEIRRKDRERHQRKRANPAYAKAELQREKDRKAAVRRALGMKERRPKQ